MSKWTVFVPYVANAARQDVRSWFRTLTMETRR